MTVLVTYDAARHALQLASSVDDAKDIRDKAEALRLYAKQRGDVEMERWVAEIKVRAARRIGQLSAALETGAGRPSENIRGAAKNLKRDALKAAGISKDAAHRWNVRERPKGAESNH